MYIMSFIKLGIKKGCLAIAKYPLIDLIISCELILIDRTSKLSRSNIQKMAVRKRFERLTARLEGVCSIQLS